MLLDTGTVLTCKLIFHNLEHFTHESSNDKTESVFQSRFSNYGPPQLSAAWSLLYPLSAMTSLSALWISVEIQNEVENYSF